MAQPDFIDNIDGNTLAKALREVLGAGSQGYGDGRNPDEVRIATAFFSLHGFARISSSIGHVADTRILLGSDPIVDAGQWKKRLDETDHGFMQRKMKDRLTQQEKSIRVERDCMPFSRETVSVLERLASCLETGNVQVRRFTENFLHAKAYIFSRQEADSPASGVIAGSSNLTAAGLSSNLELNLGRYDRLALAQACDWFDRLWERAEPFDLISMFQEALVPRTPFEIFIRVLWELYGDEIDQDEKSDRNLPLTSFQKHGVVRALRLIDECGGVIVADEVGLGKTFIAGEIMSNYQERRQRAVLICPAALRDSTWKKFTSDFQIYLEVLSYEQLAMDQQLYDRDRRKNAKMEHLKRAIDEYQLVIIDEAHNYRNPDSPYRADALRALLYGRRKDLLMLTATPVNNSLWDLYHLTRFFLKQDSFLSKKGILSIRERFETAMRIDPHNLSPDVLYPVIDAIAVKRTRSFVKKHYPNDEIMGPDGKMMPIVFPQPHAISVRYDLDDLHPELFDLIETYLDPDSPKALTFARYSVQAYLLDRDPEYERQMSIVTGLLLSGLLKRFESSSEAFRISIGRMIRQHDALLKSLNKGHIVTTEFFKELSPHDNADFDELLKDSDYSFPAKDYNITELEANVRSDHEKLKEIHSRIASIKPGSDPKLREMSRHLVMIARQAQEEAGSREDEIQRRKVLIFSYFADSVRWVESFLKSEIKRNPDLAVYRDRIDMVVGSGAGEDSNKALAAQKFSPQTAGSATGEDLTDVLVCTDVLAEGVNLQQCRHIINYDMPWNPMRLVQRHGRIDRIGSRHNRIYLRTIFPTDRLDALLKLEEKILRKIAMAAASIGVASPVAEVSGNERVFSETREEIEKLLDEDPSLYERGGTPSAAQSGEEYRQTLRKALAENRKGILDMPWKCGSGMVQGDQQGMFFCAKVGERTYLRFIHCNDDWKPCLDETKDSLEKLPRLTTELATCLRLIECTQEQTIELSAAASDAAYDLWPVVRNAIWRDWMYETDPLNLQPKVRPLNRKVAHFIRDSRPSGIQQMDIDKALDILETPWPRRDENRLKIWFEKSESLPSNERAATLVKRVLESGLEPSLVPEPLPIIGEDDVELLVWMAVQAESL